MEGKSLLAALALVLGVSACKSDEDKGGAGGRAGGRGGNTPPPTVVDVIVASPQSVTHTIEVNGSVVAAEFVEVRPETAGRLTYLNVPEGARIARGAVIARINDADLRAQLNRVRVQLDLAQKTEARLRRLVEVNGINQSDYDAALNQVNTLRADISVLEAQLDKTVVRAPFSGVVGLRQISPGAYVSPTSVIATIQKIDQVKVDFNLPEVNADLVRRGSAVVVDFGTGQRHRAVVTAIEPRVNVNTRNVQVRAVLQNGISSPGSFAKVYIDATGKSRNAILVPSNAIIPEAKAKKLVLVKGGKAEFVNVETGLRKETNVEILSGVNAGDTVVVSGVLFARPGNPVKIGKVKTLEQVSDSAQAAQ